MKDFNFETYQKKNVLITGGAGFIGSHVVVKLLDAGYSVIVIDDFSTGNKKFLEQLGLKKVYKLNLVTDNYEFVFEHEKPDFVIHLAAQTSVQGAELNPLLDANINIIATIKLLDICRKYNIKKLVAASTAAVYGEPKHLPIDEKHSTKPLSQYGLSKLTMEKYIQLSGIPYVIFRFSNAYGPRQNSSPKGGVVAIFNKAMKNNDKIHIYGDGTQIRDFVFVEDIASILSKVLDKDIQNEILNFSTNKGISINELFKILANIYNYNKTPIYLNKKNVEIQDSILSNKNLLSKFKNIKFTDLKEGLRKLKNEK